MMGKAKDFFAAAVHALQVYPQAFDAYLWREEWRRKFAAMGMSDEEALTWMNRTLQRDFLGMAKGEIKWWEDSDD